MELEKVLIAFAAALAVGLTALATAWAQSKIGAAGAGTLAEKPDRYCDHPCRHPGDHGDPRFCRCGDDPLRGIRNGTR